MRSLLTFAGVAGFYGCTGVPVPGADLPKVKPATPEVVVYFAPVKGNPISERIVSESGLEMTWIRVCGFSMTDTPELDSWIAAKGRGVDVQIIDDAKWMKSNPLTGGAALKKLLAANIPVFLDSQHPIAHAKFVIWGTRPLVEFGSYNFTKQANANHECVAFVTDQIVHDQFVIDWNNHQAHSVRAK